MITEKISGIATRFKNTFNRDAVSAAINDPRNATREMTPGKGSDPSKFMNIRPKKDVFTKLTKTTDSAFYTKVTAGQRPRLKKGDSLADVPAKLFNLIKKNQEDKRLNFEIYRDIDRPSEIKDETDRHKEIIEALNTRRKQTEDLEKATEKSKREYEKSKAEADKVIEEAKKKAAASTETVPTTPSTPVTPSTKPTVTTKPVETTPAKPTVTTKPAEITTAQKTVSVKQPPSAKPAETPPVAPVKQTAAPTQAPVTTPSISTAAKVGLGVAALGATTIAIGGAESGGNYNITFGDTLDKNRNVVHGPNMSPEDLFGKKLTDLTLEEVDVLGKERNKKSPSTSAMGKYQFMNSTLFGAKDKKGVFHPGLIQQSGLDMKTTKFTPEVQDKLFKMLHEQDVSTLKRLGVPLTPGYEYMAHYIGAGGAKAVYDRKNTNMTVEQALIDANLPDPVKGKTNIELATIKASEFESILEKRLNKQGLTPHASTIPGTTKSDKLNSSSSTNKDLKSQDSSTVIIDNTQTNIVGGGTGKQKQIISQPSPQDLPMFQQVGP
jgi:hypothetical protein